MSVVTVAATPQPANVPPRVKVDVTDTGTPAVNSVTVLRKDANGRSSVVRTPDGGPLQLTTSGSNRVATVFDYEAPFGTPVQYTTAEQPANTSASVSVDVTDVWLVHVGVPSRSQIIDLRINSLDEEEFGVNSGVFYPMGRDNAVYITDGRRHSAASELLVGTDTLDQYRALKALIADAGVLLLNVNPSLGLGQDAAYIGVLDVRAKRRTDIGSSPFRDFSLPFVTVDAPVGGSQAQYTWADVQARYATWQALMDANATWAAVQTPTN